MSDRPRQLQGKSNAGRYPYGFTKPTRPPLAQYNASFRWMKANTALGHSFGGGWGGNWLLSQFGYVFWDISLVRKRACGQQTSAWTCKPMIDLVIGSIRSIITRLSSINGPCHWNMAIVILPWTIPSLGLPLLCAALLAFFTQSCWPCSGCPWPCLLPVYPHLQFSPDIAARLVA